MSTHTDTDYYLVDKHGKYGQIIAGFMEERKAAHAKRVEVTKKYGAKAYYSRTNSIVGLIYEDESKVPPSLVVKKMDNANRVFVPNKRTKAGKQLVQEFYIPMPDGMTFHMRVWPEATGFGVTVGHGPSGGFQIRWILYEIVGDEWILSVPRNMDGEIVWQPTEGATPLKLSEYYAKKEALAEKKAA